MKKIITILVLALVCAFGFAGCSGDNYNNRVSIKGVQNTNYEVVGQGGSAVQYGNYLYFINGTRGYEDTDGTNNVYGEVVKGALYRAELVGNVNVNDNTLFTIARDEESGIKLVSEKGLSYDNKEINVVDVQLISSKTIGTSGYADGGLFIYGDYVYYASPCNGRGRDGVVMTAYNEFFRTNILTGETQSLLVSDTANNDQPYAFYCFNDKIYLNYVESGETKYIVSAEIGNGKSVTRNIIADKVTDVVMLVCPSYKKGMDTNTVYDFIYYGGNGSDIESYRSDSFMAFVRPDGTENFIFNSGNDAKLLGVEGGMLLFRMSENTTTVIKANDMHNYFMSASESYKTAFGDKVYQGAFGGDQLVLASDNIASATAIDIFVPGYGVNTNSVYVLLTATNSDTSSNNDLTLYAPNGTVTVVATAASAKFQTATTDKIYYSATTGSELQISSVNFDGTENAIIFKNATSATFNAEVEAGHLIFFGAVDGNEYTGYTLFYDLNGLEGVNEPYFVGERKSDEKRSNVGSIELDTEKAKLTYVVGESLDVSGLKITAYSYEDLDGEKTVVKDNIDVTADMVRGFDTTTVTDRVTLTVTYEGATATYDIAVINQNAKTTSCGSISVGTDGFIGGLIVLLLAGAVIVVTRRKRIA